MATVTIYLPKNAHIKVRENDKVEFGQELANCDFSSENVIYNLAKLLSIKAKETVSAVKKKEGDEVKKNEVLAKKSKLFGFLKKKVVVTFHGKVARIDYEKGEIEIAPLMVQSKVIVSPVEGKVVKIDKEEIVVDFNGIIVFAKRGIGKMKNGDLSVLARKDDKVSLSDIKEDHKEKILLGGKFSRPVLEKAFGVGVASVIATDIDDGDFLHFEESTFFNPSLILIAKADYEELTRVDGKKAVVEGEHKRVMITI